MGARRSYNASLVNDGCGDWMRYYVVVVGFGIANFFLDLRKRDGLRFSDLRNGGCLWWCHHCRLGRESLW